MKRGLQRVMRLASAKTSSAGKVWFSPRSYEATRFSISSCQAASISEPNSMPWKGEYGRKWGQEHPDAKRLCLSFVPLMSGGEILSGLGALPSIENGVTPVNRDAAPKPGWRDDGRYCGGASRYGISTKPKVPGGKSRVFRVISRKPCNTANAACKASGGFQRYCLRNARLRRPRRHPPQAPGNARAGPWGLPSRLRQNRSAPARWSRRAAMWRRNPSPMARRRSACAGSAAACRRVTRGSAIRSRRRDAEDGAPTVGRESISC